MATNCRLRGCSALTALVILPILNDITLQPRSVGLLVPDNSHKLDSGHVLNRERDPLSLEQGSDMLLDKPREPFESLMLFRPHLQVPNEKAKAPEVGDDSPFGRFAIRIVQHWGALFTL